MGFKPLKILKKLGHSSFFRNTHYAPSLRRSLPRRSLFCPWAPCKERKIRDSTIQRECRRWNRFSTWSPRKPGSVFYWWKYGELKTPVFHVMIWGSSNWNKLFEVDVSGIKSKCIGFPRHPGQYNWQVWNPRVNEGVRVLRYPAPLKKWIHSKRLQGKNTKSKAATLSFFLYPFDSFEGKSVQPRRPLENVPNIELFFQLKKSTAEVSGLR